MKEEIIRFRELCNVLIEEKDWSLKRLAMEIKVSPPTLDRIRTSDLDDLKGVHASTLGAIQDFCKRHREVLEYAGIESDPETVRKLNSAVDVIKEHTEDMFKKKKQVGSEPIPSNPVLDFWMHLGNAYCLKPDNVDIVITINSKP
jgi:hypothetical protein